MSSAQDNPKEGNGWGGSAALERGEEDMVQEEDK
jgi:hypothetical protein